MTFLLRLALLSVALAFSLPLLWVVFTAFKGDQQLVQAPLTLWPTPWQADNFQRALKVVPVHRYTWNTLCLALTVGAAHLVSCPLAAYALARLRQSWVAPLRALTLAAMVVPYPVVMVPQYLLFQKLGLVNTFWPLVLPSLLGNAFFIVYLSGVFRSFPRELEEAARLEGATPWQVLFGIVLPLCRPALVTVFVLSIASVWNDFLGPLLYLQDPSLYTVNLGLQFYRDSHQVAWNLMMAATCMSILPVTLLFVLAQRSFLGEARS